MGTVVQNDPFEGLDGLLGEDAFRQYPQEMRGRIPDRADQRQQSRLRSVGITARAVEQFLPHPSFVGGAAGEHFSALGELL